MHLFDLYSDNLNRSRGRPVPCPHILPKESATDWIDIASHFFSSPLTVFILVLMTGSAAAVVASGVRMWKGAIRTPRPVPKRSYISLRDGALTWVDDDRVSRRGAGLVRVWAPAAGVYVLIISVLYVFAIPFLGFYIVASFLAGKVFKSPGKQRN